MRNISKKKNPLFFNRGFIIFIITGIVAVLGLLLVTLNWMTRQQNIQSHKSRYNEVARTSAEAGLQLLIRAIREGIKTPSEIELQSMSQNSKFHQNSFYGFFLQTSDKLFENSDQNQLTHSVLINLFPRQMKVIHETYQKTIPGLKLEYSINLESKSLYSYANGEEVLKDKIEKKLNLELICEATYKGTTKKYKFKKYMNIYNLISPITSKFTFFHKSSSGDRYNKLITNLLGKPIIDQSGDFKYPYNFPLVLINGPLDNDPQIPGDSFLLSGKGGNSFENMNHLSDKDELEKSRKIILQRGFLYFGPGENNILRLTPGSDPLGWGEYFHLFNPMIGNNPNTYPAQIINSPDFFQRSHIVQNSEPLNSETYGKAILQSVYEGFYEPDIYIQNRPDPSHHILSGYSAYSSLIHPFGTYLAFNRAYTVGNAYRSIVKISSVGVDRVDTPNDEIEQANCLRVPSVQQRDGRMAILREATEEGWEGTREFTLNPLIKTMDNLHRLRPEPDGYINVCENEPETISVDSQFNYDAMFSNYEQYSNFMSRIEKLPINHTIDYPHFTNEVIPPNDHQNFTQFMFAPHEKERLYDFADDNLETWFLSPSKFNPEGSLYLKGQPEDFNVDELRTAQTYFSLSGSNDGIDTLLKEDLLRNSSGYYALNTHGHLIKIDGNLTLDKKLLIENHSALMVSGVCSIGEISSQYYFNLNCDQVVFLNDEEGEGYNSDVFLNAKRTISKQNPQTAVSIQGGIAMDQLDYTMFQAPTTVIYSPSYSPLGTNYKYFYRMVLDDHNREWKGQI